MEARALVRAVLAPHHAEDSQLGVSRLAAEDLDDFLILARRELVLGDQVVCDGDGAHGRTSATGRAVCAAASMDSKTPRPSEEPISGSEARSGCGIMPITLRSRLRMPAISRSEPLGLSR